MSWIIDLEEGDDPLIPLPNVEKEVLKKIIDYMEYHHEEPAAEIERPLKTRLEDIICEWDRGFLDEISTEDRVMLFKVILVGLCLISVMIFFIPL